MAESKPPLGRRMKARAPPPPQAPLPAPRHIFRNVVPNGGGTSGVDSMLRPIVELQLTLPWGQRTAVTEDGSKALMDLLVKLCSRYHLNPALHTLELLSPEGQTLGFKPNALLGSLDVACVLIKEKVWEEKATRRPAPKVPEKSVRLMVNYHGSQKAVVRVNPLVPLQALIPIICDKCEFDAERILLLKDSVSRHELPLDRSLTDLGIKELYVHDQRLVLQPKMASAPALNYSDSILSSTASLGRAEKKGLLGIFKFSRRKTKTETTSVDMDDCDGKVIQCAETHDNGLSTASVLPNVAERPSTLGQSQSVMNIPRLSPKAEAKKRRAPALPGAPTPTMGHTSYEGYETSLGSESQQRKRKAPAPPPTPASITPGPDDTSASADSHAAEAPASQNKAAQSDSVSATVLAINPVLFKTTVHPPPASTATPTPDSPTPSSSTTDSLVVQDSSSDLSHGLDDSDADLDQAVSYCSSLTSSTASGSVLVQPATKSSGGRVEEAEKATRTTAKLNQEATSASSSRSDTESALNLKVDEVENNRHSTMGAGDRLPPPKPRRSPALDQPRLVPPPTLSSPPIEPTDSSCLQSPVEAEDAAPQSWLHSTQSASASFRKPETGASEEETVSLGSSSGGSSLPDQGYAASEGMAEGEDSGMVSSPSDTQPTSPDGSLSLDGGGETLPGPVRDNSSDSDEGCATWGSRHRHNATSPKQKAGMLTDDPELTAQLHHTLAGFEANLADHREIVSAKQTPYRMSTDSNEVPVSVVDMDVPVTAIDEVLEDYEHHDLTENETESADSKESGFRQQSSVEPQNHNNNARTAANSKKSSSTNTEQRRKSPEHKSVRDKKEKVQEKKITDTNCVKRDQQRAASAVKSNADLQKHSRSTEICNDTQSAERDVSLNNSPNASQGKITCSATSRFGMKTFTVVPPKPSVMHAATGETAVKLTAGAIKIDDQGNMVKGTFSRSRASGSSESGINSGEGSPLLGKAKAFWSSNEKQDSCVPQSRDVSDKAKESTDGLKSPPTAVSLKSSEDAKTTQTSRYKPAQRDEPQEAARDVKVVKEESGEAESRISVSKTVQQPSNKATLPPPLLTDLKRDLSFLKPSRRTSSQYMASAIVKNTPKTSAKPSCNPNVRDSSASLTSHAIAFQRSGRSIKVNPHQSSQASSSDNKENDSVPKSNPPGPKRSMSYPEYVSERQRDFREVRPDRGRFGSCLGSSDGSSNTLETETAKSRHVQPSGPAQKNIMAKNDSENFQQIMLRSSAQSDPVRSSAKQTASPALTSSTMDGTKAAADANASVTVSDGGVTPAPPAVTLFGPVKKFRPVISRSVEKDTTLHSSLMEAIQTGGGRDRLKKISTCGLSGMKKASYVEEQNERSALLAAIRAQSSSGRLRKTKSEAADELDKFREEQRDGPVSSPSPPHVFTPPPPPPPPAPMSLAPPPAPVFPLVKPNTALNPALAREAMLEAIRSGSAAEKLKKVAAPTKTIQVNGRLGTIQATASTQQ